MAKVRIEAETVADAYLALLAKRGVDYLFANAGTDFAPIIEAFSKAKVQGRKVPTPILVPHENAAVSMAHGYWMVTGRMQAAMVHVGPGTANSLNAIMNASRQRVPILMTAGRTPINESGVTASRDTYIHWAQEQFDQGAMIREFVKWDYELRNGSQIETVVDRALALARSEPRAPVYLILPREVLAGPLDGLEVTEHGMMAPTAPPQPDGAAIARAAELLSRAQFPVIITAEAGETSAGVEALAALAARHAIPVVQYRARYLCLPDDHPMHLGYDPGALLREADAVVVVETDVPWIPNETRPGDDVPVIQIGVDPLYARYPVRGFRADIAIAGNVPAALTQLDLALANGKGKGELAKSLSERAAKVAALRKTQRARWAEARQKAEQDTEIQQTWAGACIERIRSDDDIIVNEYTLALDQVALKRPGCYFGNSPVGGLGWGLGAALGAKLSAPERTVIAVLGDGSYMFGNPTPAHYVSAANQLPILTVVLNNAMWGAVRRATTTVYPTGYASRDNMPALTYIEPSPQFEKVVEASGGYGERVEEPAQLPGALERAMKAVKVERRQALLNVLIKRSTARSS
ncbi:MAG: thiamine pyrophosphate-requiring protein [Proteobacteria bacterium]|nr:thiamine pyrophosphate-requiring protein [Pseudomonadota bacterium]